MNILHIVRQYRPAVGGLENFVECLAKEQVANSCTVTVLTLNTIFGKENLKKLSSFEVIDGINVIRVNWYGSYKYPIAFVSPKSLAEYDIIHVHALDFFADYIAFLKPILKAKLILSTHGGIFHTNKFYVLKKIFFNTITRVTLRIYDKVITDSVNDNIIFSKLNSNNLKLIVNGVDVTKYSNKSSNQFTKHFIYIGRFSDNKRLDLLIETFKYLIAKDKAIKLKIVGRDWDGLETRMSNTISENNMSEHISLLSNLTNSEVEKVIGTCSFIISASEYEGFGLSIVEGMSAGLIPVVSNIPSFEYIVNQAKIGTLIDFTDANEAAKSIHNFVQISQSKFSELRRKSLEAASFYSWRKVSGEFLQEYEKVLGSVSRRILNVDIKVHTRFEAVKIIDQHCLNRSKLLVTFANANLLNIQNQDHVLTNLLSSFYILNDGVGVNIASKFKYGKYFPENLNGTDFIPFLLSSITASKKIFIIGSRPDVVKKAYLSFAKNFSHHDFVGYHDGFYDLEYEDKVLSKIKQANPDIILVAMGNPIQEKWISRNASKLEAPIIIGVGAFFDFISGEVKRAPAILRRHNMEWLYRFYLEPKRLWKRYLIGNFVFLYSCLRDT